MVVLSSVLRRGEGVVVWLTIVDNSIMPAVPKEGREIADLVVANLPVLGMAVVGVTVEIAPVVVGRLTAGLAGEKPFRVTLRV